ncbi:MAG TPA: hypothetical protein VNW30_06445 [Opitutaceae bacterium]|jgi:hypothetical protein|nr:hypothetical protein [Opitutaceae bacterium]
MKTHVLFLSALSFFPAIFTFADQPPEPPVPVVPTMPPPAAVRPADNQQLYGGSQAPLVTPEAAKALIDKFRAAFVQNDSPRFVFYVNRELVDVESGLKLTQRTERTEAERHDVKSDMESPASAGAPQTQVNVSVSGNAGNSSATLGKGTASTKDEKVTAENTYAAKDATAPTLSDRQTVRDVERLFGRPFRAAGAHLADQKVAASLLADKPIDTFAAGAGDQARKDRDALGNVADIAVEVLVSSRQVTVTNISGDEVVTVPDIQATAIRLKDSAIVGQASSSDILGKDPQAGRIAQRYDVRDITEATSLALMQDMLTGTK